MKTISIKINCGKTTCAIVINTELLPRRLMRCQFLGSIKFGQIPVCRLFPTAEESFTILPEQGGWVQRCDECLKSTGDFENALAKEQ